jgi:hypothetical protein
MQGSEAMTSPKSSNSESNNAAGPGKGQPAQRGGKTQHVPVPAAPGEKQERDSPTWDEVDAIRKGKSDIDLAERIWQIEKSLIAAIDRERLANMRADQANGELDAAKRELAEERRKREVAEGLEQMAYEQRNAAQSATPAIPDIPSIIRRSTWRTPELRESAARLVANILRKDDDECPPQPPDHFPVS